MANIVYSLSSTEQAIKWMHAVCDYPVKSTSITTMEPGNFMGWPLLTACNMWKYYPVMAETPRGHMVPACKHVQSTKTKPQPLEVSDTTALKGKKK